MILISSASQDKKFLIISEKRIIGAYAIFYEFKKVLLSKLMTLNCFINRHDR